MLDALPLSAIPSCVRFCRSSMAASGSLSSQQSIYYFNMQPTSSSHNDTDHTITNTAIG